MTEPVTTDKRRASSAIKKTKGKAQAVQNIPTESNNAAHAEVCITGFWFLGWKELQVGEKDFWVDSECKKVKRLEYLGGVLWLLKGLRPKSK